MRTIAAKTEMVALLEKKSDSASGQLAIDYIAESIVQRHEPGGEAPNRSAGTTTGGVHQRLARCHPSYGDQNELTDWSIGTIVENSRTVRLSLCEVSDFREVGQQLDKIAHR